MKRRFFLLMLLYVIFSSSSMSASLDFYGQTFSFDDKSSLHLKRSLKANEKDLKFFYSTFHDYQNLLDSLFAFNKKLRLNDLLYYALIEKVSKYLDERLNNSNYIKWFLLGKSGFCTRIGFENGNVAVLVDTSEVIEGLFRIGKYYCLNCPDDVGRTFFASLDPFKSNPKFYKFQFLPLPRFSNMKFVKRKFVLMNFDLTSRSEIEIEFDSLLVASLERLGNFNLLNTFSAEMEPSVRVLLNEICKIVGTRNDSVKVAYAMDFIARNSTYSTSWNDKWQTPEEILFYKKGDCEDRSSFLFYLLKHLVDKPLVIIHYPKEEHFNIAISLTLKSEPNFMYRGKPYYVCEATTENGFIQLGKDDLVKKTSFKIVGEYNPE